MSLAELLPAVRELSAGEKRELYLMLRDEVDPGATGLQAIGAIHQNYDAAAVLQGVLARPIECG
jgi:hypothetical protein